MIGEISPKQDTMALLDDIPGDLLGRLDGRAAQLDFLLGTQESSEGEGFPGYNGGESYACRWGHTGPRRPLGCAEVP